MTYPTDPRLNPYAPPDQTQLPDAPIQPSATLSERLTYINQNHPQFDASTATAFAQSPMTLPDVSQSLNALNENIKANWNGLALFHDDGVLKKQPTQALAVTNYLHQTLGAPPIEEPDLKHVQDQLKKRGYGRDLATDGVWSASWNSAYQQAGSAHADEQLSGNKPGSQSAGHAAHSFLDSILPKGALSHIIGYVKSIPGDLRTLVADSVGLGTLALRDAGEVAKTTATGEFDYGKAVHVGREAARDTARSIENTLGNNLSAKQERINTTGAGNIFAKTLNDAATAFMFAPAAGAGAQFVRGGGKALTQAEASAAGGLVTNSFGGTAARMGFRMPIVGPAAQRIAAAAGENAGSMLTRDAASVAAQRTPGLIGNSVGRVGAIGNRALTGAAVGAVAGGATRAYQGGDVLGGVEQGAVYGALGGALIPGKAFTNMPVLGRLGPKVAKLADADGLYYKSRAFLATPYQFGAVRTAGAAVGALEVAGLKAGALGGVENMLGSGDETGTIGYSNRLNEHVLDHFDDAIKSQTKFTFQGHTYHPGLNELAFLVHPDFRDPFRPSTQVGDSVTATMRKISGGLGDIGATGQFELASGKSMAQHIREQEGPDGQGQAIVHKFIDAKLTEASVSYQGTRNAQQATPGWSKLELMEQKPLLEAEEQKLWNGPSEDIAKAKEALLAAGGGQRFRRYLQDQMNSGARDKSETTSQGMRAYVKAHEVLNEKVVPSTSSLLTPGNLKLVSQRQDYAAELADADKILKLEGPLVRPATRTASYLGAEGEQAPLGSIGLAKVFRRADGSEDLSKSTLTQQHALSDQTAFKKRQQAILEGGGDIQPLNEEMRAYAFHHYATNGRALSHFDDQTGDKLLTHLEERANGLAAEVHLPHDASPEMRAAYKEIDDHGFRVVAGTDIGHSFRSDLPPLADLGAPISRARKIIAGMGLSPEHVSSLDVASKTQLEMTRALNQAHEDPNNAFRYLPYDNARSILNQLQDDNLVGKEPSTPQNIMYALGRNKKIARRMAAPSIKLGANPMSALAQAESELKSQIASQGGVLALGRKDITKVLSRTGNKPLVYKQLDEQGVELADQVPLYSEDAALAAYKALNTGAGRIGAGLLGAGQVEPLIRSLAINGRLTLPGTRKIIGGTATELLQNLPAQYMQVRNAYRFQLSPFFSFRRVTKTALKMGVDGVAPPPGLDPLRAMENNQSFVKYHDVLDRINPPNSAYKSLDENDRLLHGQDVFGLFNSRHWEAWYAGRMEEAGASDAEIKQGLVRVFKYGSKANGEGRTALEKTTNTIFFPFSFEKTVGRNIGGYLLDRPAQAIVLTNALSLYKEFNDRHLDGSNPLAASFAQEHLPLLHELLRLNAFAHGFSAGEFGGLNAPLLNLFLPQSVASTPGSTKLLKRMIPVWTDAARILKEGQEQTQIVGQSLSNLNRVVTGPAVTDLNPLPSTKEKQPQLSDAYAYRNNLIAQAQPVLDYNAKHPNDAVTFPATEDFIRLGVRGQAISKTNIGLLVNAKFPAFDPAAGVLYGVQKKAEVKTFVSSQTDPARYAQYDEFVKNAATVIANLNKEGSYDPAQAEQVMQIFRTQATKLAEKDAGFYKLYNKAYRSTFGPLEKQNG